MAESANNMYMEGNLFKRQRGLHKTSLRGLKFQERFCSLNTMSLEYFEILPKKKVFKGQFPLERIRIVEMISPRTFHKDNCFQIGDEQEVMYFSAKSSRERDQWIEALRKAVSDKGNQMLAHYHTGACGLSSLGKWSCCGKEKTSKGCCPVISRPMSDARPYSVGDVLNLRGTDKGLDSAQTGSDIRKSDVRAFSSWDSFPVSQKSHSLPKSVRILEDDVFLGDWNTAGEQRAGPYTGINVLPGVQRQSMYSLTPEASDNEESVEHSELYIAIINDNFKQLKDLLQGGADPNEMDPVSKSACLHLASKKGCTDIVELLLAYNADVSLTDTHGNTALLVACKNGHLSTANMLVDGGAEVDQAGENERTPLHEATETGHTTVVKWLIGKGADTLTRDNKDNTPYDLAFKQDNKELMQLLQESMPEGVRPYKLLDSHTLPDAVTSLAFCGNDRLAAGSRDSHVHLWEISDFSVSREMILSNTVVSVDTWGHFLAIGSDAIQVVDMSAEKLRRIVIADDESLPNPPLYLVGFAPTGHLATASVENNVVKVWPPPPLESSIIKPPCKACITVGETPGCICSLSVSPSHNHPFLAVGVQPGKQFRPVGNKQVYLYEWETGKLHCIPFDIGHGGLSINIHTMFSPDGNYLAVGCNTNLCIWETNTGTPVCNVTPNDLISSLRYSPTGEHLSVGECNGEVQVYEVNSGVTCPIFTLRKPENSSAATGMDYSRDGKIFVVGHQNGFMQLWKAYPQALRQDDSWNESLPKPSNEPVIVRTDQYEVDSKGKEYLSTHDGYAVFVPRRAVPEGRSISLLHGVVCDQPFHQAPFHYPDGVSPVSTIMWFCPTPEIQFSKPIEITLQHCAECKSEEDCQSLVFLKADQTDVTTSPSGNQIIQFRPVDEEAVFLPNTYHGTLHTNHFRYLCIGRRNIEKADKTSYCLITAIPTNDEGRMYFDIYFCITYYLDTCLKALSEQFEDEYSLFCQNFAFPDTQQNPALEIKYERHLPGGWMVTRKGPNKIYTKDLHFWRQQFQMPREMMLESTEKMNSPRFILEVSGKNATEDTILEVEFVGASESMSTEIKLRCSDLQSPTKLPLMVSTGTQTTDQPMDFEAKSHVGEHQPVSWTISLIDNPRNIQLPAPRHRIPSIVGFSWKVNKDSNDGNTITKDSETQS